MKRFLIAALLIGASACDGCECVSTDYPVSSAVGSTASHHHFSQAETSMVRIDLPPNRERDEPASRFVVGYNDGTDSMVGAGGGCWAFGSDGRRSLDGWATSDDFGGPWVRHDQLPVSAALSKMGVRARHGDPWLAVWNSKHEGSPGLIAYVSVAQSGLPRFGPPWFLVVNRSHDHGASFDDGQVVLGPQDVLPDGPKIAITGAGTSALVAWKPEGVRVHHFRMLVNLDDPTMTLVPEGELNPDPPPGCTLVSVASHPHLAAGHDSYYLAGEYSYSCPTGQASRIEVYRNFAIGLALGVPWRRILSKELPPNVAGPLRGRLNIRDIINPPEFGADVDRGDIVPSIAVAEDEGGEVVVVITNQLQAGTAAGEMNRERLIQFRIGNADTCSAPSADLASCSTASGPTELDSISTPNDMRTVSSRAGLWASKPAVFSGKVPDGTVDKRFAVVWYAQPYKGRSGATPEQTTRTIVEAAVSIDGGLSYEGPFNLTAATEGDGIFTDPDIGEFFWPCALMCVPNFYGEYLSGAFQFGAAPESKEIVAAWGDSREGCTDETPNVQHMHVWAGAIRGRAR